MDLEYGPEYQDFTKEVESFCKKYKGLSFSDGSNNPLGSSGGSDGPQMSRSEWQKTLIENGYFARSVPKEYGGYGGEVDILKSRIIAAEFSKSKLQEQWVVKGLICWFPRYWRWVLRNKNKPISNLHSMVK
jgi:alkylation response protein AidB-like acyl-CoA dehydrogenase